MPRRIKKANIKFLSLVKRGANQIPLVYKSEDRTFEVQTLAKTEVEKGEIYSLVYVPEKVDSQGDIASADVIKDMMYDASRNGLNIDIHHNGKALTKDQVFIAETFLVQKNDPRFSDIQDYNGESVDATGSWGTVIKVEDEDLKKELREGTFNGISMAGTAVLEEEQEKQDSSLIKDLLKGIKEFLHPHKEEKVTMTEDQVKELIKAALVDFTTKEEPAKKEETSFEGDINNPEDVKKHLAKITKEDDQIQEQIAKLQQELDTIKKASRQVTVTTKKTDSEDTSPLIGMEVSKEDADCFSIGKAMAKFINN